MLLLQVDHGHVYLAHDPPSTTSRSTVDARPNHGVRLRMLRSHGDTMSMTATTVLDRLATRGPIRHEHTDDVTYWHAMEDR